MLQRKRVGGVLFLYATAGVISVQSKVAGDHKMYDRKYYIMVASTARSIDMLNKTLTTIQRTMAEEDIQKEFVITAVSPRRE